MINKPLTELDIILGCIKNFIFKRKEDLVDKVINITEDCWFMTVNKNRYGTTQKYIQLNIICNNIRINLIYNFLNDDLSHDIYRYDNNRKDNDIVEILNYYYSKIKIHLFSLDIYYDSNLLRKDDLYE